MATFSDNIYATHYVDFCLEGETLWSGHSDGTVVMRRMRDIVPSNEQASEDLCSMMSGLSFSPRRRLTV